MLGFTLSKLNLLILVTALFAIIAFFLFSLTDLVVSGLAQRMVADYSESVFGIVHSDSLCWKSTATIPESIQYFGGFTPTKEFYYVMKIKRFPETPKEGELNTLIFQIANRKDQGKLIATSSISLDAEILLYDWNPETGQVSQGSEFVLDPMSALSPKNSLVIVKEVYMGKNFLHMIACSSSSLICEANLTRASCLLPGGRKSACFPECGS